MNELTLGHVATASKTMTDDDVRKFADLVGDHNPIHLDEAFARNTRLGHRIVHGLLTASLISTAIGTHLCKGAIYLSQTLQFVAPVYLGDTVTARVTVTEIRNDKPVVTLETVCVNQLEEPVIKGQAKILIDELRDKR